MSRQPFQAVPNKSTRHHSNSQAPNAHSQLSTTHLQAPNSRSQRTIQPSVSRNLTQVIDNRTGSAVTNLDSSHDHGPTGICIHFVTYGCIYRSTAPTIPNAPTITQIDCTRLQSPGVPASTSPAGIANIANNRAVSDEFFSNPAVRSAYNAALRNITSSVQRGCSTVVLKSTLGVCRSILMAAKLAVALDGRAKCYFINVDQEKALQDLGADTQPRGGSRVSGARGGLDGRSSQMYAGM